MDRGFWDTLERPFFVLAPMADVTDAAFRRIIATYGKPDVVWTEFVSADGLLSKGREVLLRDLMFTEAERPIVAQLFTGSPERMEKAATLVANLGFDGLDINMGCPDRSVEKQGAGAALIKDPKRAQEIIRAAQEGVRAAGKTIPVSVKTRIGYNKNEIETWLPALLSAEPAALTIHARTRKEMSLVPAHWDVVAEVVKLRDELQSEAFIIGNGDARNLVDARAKVLETGADGTMLGRAIFGNPWLFSDLTAVKHGKKGGASTFAFRERVRVLIEHVRLFEELLGDIKSFSIMKKHFKAYIEGFPGAQALRTELMATKNAAEVATILETHLLR
jgi:nifR3 family TIM-barrel protein